MKQKPTQSLGRPRLDILFLCGLFPENKMREIENNSYGPIQYAANLLQSSILEGLKAHTSNITTISLPFIGSFPGRYKKCWLKTETIRDEQLGDCTYAGFINISLIKMLSRYHIALRQIRKWARRSKGRKLVLVYSMHSPFLCAAVRARKRSSTEICLIAPDMPQFMSGSRSIAYRLLKSIDSMLINRAVRYVDYYVLLSKHMAEGLGIQKEPWIVVEGIFGGAINEKRSSPPTDEKVVLYTGTFDPRYGIMNLLDAFRLIDDSRYRLWICGEGLAKKIVIERAKSDSRIKYFGQLPHAEVIRLQRSATVLVNPRTSIGEYTKYSFPSKILEYMASGTPCIMHRLPGIPEEYFSYSFIAQEETAEGLKKKILSVCSMDSMQLLDAGRAAQEFVRKSKNPIHQARRIYDLLTGCSGRDLAN